MVSLILWFNATSLLDLNQAKEDIRFFFLPSNDPDPGLVGVEEKETTEGKFIIACKGWKRNFYQPWLVDEINALPGRLRDTLVRIEIMTDVKFSKTTVRGRSLTLAGDFFKRPTLYEHITEDGSKIGVEVGRYSLQVAVHDLSIAMLDFLKDAATNRFAEQALKLLDFGTPSALAGVRRKLAQIEAISYMHFEGSRHEAELEDSDKK